MENDMDQFKTLNNLNLEDIRSPTLLFHGDKDENVPFSFSQNAAKRIPKANLFKMKGKDHYAFFLSYGDTVNVKIIEFIKGVEENKN
jgi:pimeloyl-ACP methyl ester carboxylesterase